MDKDAAKGLIDEDRVTEAADGAEPINSLSAGAIARSLFDVAIRGEHYGRRGMKLGKETLKAVAGRSDVEPEKGDWRFKDEAWRLNPVYRRIMRIYLIWARELMQAAEDADLEPNDADRARFCMEVLTTAAAPTNSLIGNPAALKRVFDTSGKSLVRGARNAVDDALTNGRMPRQVPRNAYELGVDLAATPGAVVYRDEFFELLQFDAIGSKIMARPVLIVPPQIKSLLLHGPRARTQLYRARGLPRDPVFAISWRNPAKDQADWSLDDYAEAAQRAIDAVGEISLSDDVNLLSLCAGGILTAGLLTHLTAEGDTRINSASFGVTCSTSRSPRRWGCSAVRRCWPLRGADPTPTASSRAARLGSVFSWMRPNDLVWNYWVNNYLLGKDPPLFDILAWNSDATNLPGRLHSDFLEIFQNNLMAKKGGLQVLGTPVTLARWRLKPT